MLISGLNCYVFQIAVLLKPEWKTHLYSRFRAQSTRELSQKNPLQLKNLALFPPGFITGHSQKRRIDGNHLASRSHHHELTPTFLSLRDRNTR